MGWWRISDIETGGIDWGHTCPTNTAFTNAVPKVDTPHALYNGDGPADEMGETFDKIDELYLEAWGRKATKEEFIAIFNFCIGGKFYSKED